jgi:hypothetical protein
MGPWEFGWDALVAIGTLTLAAVTGILAAITSRMASKTSDLATETAEDVRSGIRPALIDAAGRAKPTLTMDGSVDVGTITVSVGNAGRGPALNVYAYAFAASKAFAKRTLTVMVGNIAPGESATIKLADVPSVDTSGSLESYLALRVVCVYSDLAGRQYHTVIRLSDPGKGQRRRQGGDDSAGGYDSLSESLTQDGIEVGDGAAPPPQWWVSFYGNTTPEQREALRANAIQLIGRHGVGTAGSLDAIPAEPSAWTHSVLTSAETHEQAIERVKAALGEGAFGAWGAELWTSDRFPLPPETPS